MQIAEIFLFQLVRCSLDIFFFSCWRTAVIHSDLIPQQYLSPRFSCSMFYSSLFNIAIYGMTKKTLTWRTNKYNRWNFSVSCNALSTQQNDASWCTHSWIILMAGIIMNALNVIRSHTVVRVRLCVCCICVCTTLCIWKFTLCAGNEEMGIGREGEGGRGGEKHELIEKPYPAVSICKKFF